MPEYVLGHQLRGEGTRSQKRGIDYYIGRTLAPRLAPLGLTNIIGIAETAVYKGGFIMAGLLD